MTKGQFEANVLPGHVWVRTVNIPDSYGESVANPAFEVEVQQQQSFKMENIEVEFKS